METQNLISHQTRRDYQQIDQALAGNQQAYRALFKRYWRQLFFTVNKMIADREEARDVTMEALSKAFFNLHRFEKKYGFNTWLYRFVINYSLDHLRRKRLPTAPLSMLMVEEANEYGTAVNDPRCQRCNPEVQMIACQRQMAIEGHLRALPGQVQQIARMRFVEAYSYEEIARTLSLPMGTVKARIHRARCLLHHALLPLRSQA